MPPALLTPLSIIGQNCRFELQELLPTLSSPCLQEGYTNQHPCLTTKQSLQVMNHFNGIQSLSSAYIPCQKDIKHLLSVLISDSNQLHKLESLFACAVNNNSNRGNQSNETVITLEAWILIIDQLN